MSETKHPQSYVEIGLNAVIISIVDGYPSLLRIENSASSQTDALPYGPFDPTVHRTMEKNLREFVEEQTTLNVGYVEQLYTFGDRGRNRIKNDIDPHVVSVGYLALTRATSEQLTRVRTAGADWKNCYSYLPWEDWRGGRPAIIDETILPALERWIEQSSDPFQKKRNSLRMRFSFGAPDIEWDDERVLERYELLYSAGLIQEAINDGRFNEVNCETQLGIPMLHDHRRILATALARLRSKLKYRPVIFEMMPDEFTLLSLQKTVESIFGRAVHKQNFRRLVDTNKLVEPTGATSLATGGRPAALFRFRRDILAERPAPGIKVG